MRQWRSGDITILLRILLPKRLDELYSYLKEAQPDYEPPADLKPKKKLWTFDACLRVAKKFNSVDEWCQNHEVSYLRGSQKAWIFDVCALKYTTVRNWAKFSPQSHGTALKN